MKFTEDGVKVLYEQNLAETAGMLASLPFAAGESPQITGLSGWVFEQTLRHCLSAELTEFGLQPAIACQVPVRGRAKIDLLVGNRVAIEVKSRGSWGNDTKYRTYGKVVLRKGWIYLYVTLQEGHLPYRNATLKLFGPDGAYFLDGQGEWARFVNKVAGALA